MLKGYDCERKDRQNCQSEGVAIFISENTEWNLLNVSSTIECIIVQIITRPTPIKVCHIYSNEQSTDVEIFEEILNQLPQLTFLNVDFRKARWLKIK